MHMGDLSTVRQGHILLKINQQIEQMSSRQTWTLEEDNFLCNLVPAEGKPDWKLITQSINENFTGKNRSAKQCRERYINYSHFKADNTSNSNWQTQDIDLLYELFQKSGTCWGKIAESLPGKSENSIKNKFYGALRKAIRKMNKVTRLECQKIKKKLKYQSVIRILEAAQTFKNLDTDLKKESLDYRFKILDLMRQRRPQITNAQILELVQGINKFNLTTRSFRPKKLKKKIGNEDEESLCQSQAQENIKCQSKSNGSESLKSNGQSISTIAIKNEDSGIQTHQQCKIEDKDMNLFGNSDYFERDTKQIMAAQDNYSLNEISFDLHGKLFLECSPMQYQNLF